MSLPAPPWRAALAAAFVYTVATLASGWNVVTHLRSVVVNDPTDSVLNTAILTWNAQHLPLSDAWWNFPAFAPLTDTLTFSEHLLGVSVLAAPLQWASGSGVVAYNATVLLSFPLAALAMFALVQRLTSNAPAAFTAGLAFGFGPYRAVQLAHVQMLVVCWAPVALLGLHAYLETSRRRWLALGVAGWLLQGLANLYLLVYFSVLVGVWLLWFAVRPGRWRQLAAIVVSLGIAAIPLVPVVLRYSRAHARYGLTRSVSEMRGFAADVLAPLCASPKVTLWHQLRIGCGAAGETELFPGPTMLLLCVLAAVVAVRYRDRLASFYLATAAVMWTLTWGPAPTWLGKVISPLGTFSLLLAVPGMSGLRVPSRFWMLALLCLAVALGLAMAHLLAARSRVVVMSVLGVVTAGLLADGWAVMPVVPAPAILSWPVLRGRTVMELPVGDGPRDAASQLRAASGGWRAVNGFSGYEPAAYAALREASRFETPALFASAVALDDLFVLVPDDAPRLRMLVEKEPGVEKLNAASGFQLYRLPKR